MSRRFFLSGVGALLGRKANIVRDTRSPSPAPPPSAPPPTDDGERRAQAFARLILRRAGIAPLLPMLAFALLLMLPDGAMAQATATASPIRATTIATARARILPSSVRIERGALHIADGGQFHRIDVQPQPSTRPCDPAAPSANPACRMIIYDLP